MARWGDGPWRETLVGCGAALPPLQHPVVSHAVSRISPSAPHSPATPTSACTLSLQWCTRRRVQGSNAVQTDSSQSETNLFPSWTHIYSHGTYLTQSPGTLHRPRFETGRSAVEQRSAGRHHRERIDRRGGYSQRRHQRRHRLRATVPPALLSVELPSRVGSSTCRHDSPSQPTHLPSQGNDQA